MQNAHIDLQTPEKSDQNLIVYLATLPISPPAKQHILPCPLTSVFIDDATKETETLKEKKCLDNCSSDERRSEFVCLPGKRVKYCQGKLKVYVIHVMTTMT